MKRSLVLITENFAVLSYTLDPETLSVNPIGSDLPAHISAVIGHARNEVFKHTEVLFSLVEPVCIIRHVQHPAMRPNAGWRHPKKVSRSRVEIMRWAGKANLMWEKLNLRIVPFFGFFVGVHV